MSQAPSPTAPIPALPASATITAKSGSNLALAFGCLPPDRRRAMGIFYAFCRVVDDASDQEAPVEQKRAEIAFWREEIRLAYVGTPVSPLGKEMAEIIKTYLIPPAPLEEIVNGVEMDLSISRFPNFALLEQYCYRVASAVGLVSIEIFGSSKPITKEYAIALGMAFQLTNILRDVKKDAANGRIYLPLDELAEAGLTEDDVLQSRWSPAMRKFLQFQYFRAKHYYAKSLRLIDPVDRPYLTAAEIMREVYQTLLHKIARNDFNVFQKKEIRLSKPMKVLCIARANRREKKALPLPPPPKSVLVLGGGFSGIAAAIDLIERGHTVTLLESKPFLGGRAYSFKEAKSGEEIDNGQHAFMGCYDTSLRLLDTLGSRDKLAIQKNLDLTFLSPRGRSSLKAAPLPAPFHLLVGLAGYRELTFDDRRAALAMGLRLRLGMRPRDDETADAWLKRWRQPYRLVNALWEPLCLAALNQSLQGSSAKLLAAVLERALLASAEGSRMIMAKTGLSALLSPEAERLARWCGSQVVTGAHVRSIIFRDGKCAGVETLDGRTFTADAVVSALPWNAARALLPAGSVPAEAASRLADSPIVSVHLWLDRPLLAKDEGGIVGFLNSPLHWLFDREKITGEQTSELGHPYVAVISGAASQAEKSAAEIEAEVLGEIARFLPAAKEATVRHRFVYKAKGATFAATPEAEKHRPGAVTAWPNFWLAGDWTDTGLPATIEGAAWSGYRAATAVDAAKLA